MSKRHEWEFLYSCRELVAACRERLSYHLTRIDGWTEELAAAEQELRQHGIEFRERSVTGGNRLQPTFDAERMARVEECRGKLTEHHARANQFAAFLVGFEHSPEDATIGLTYDDIMFFGFATSHALGDESEVPS